MIWSQAEIAAAIRALLTSAENVEFNGGKLSEAGLAVLEAGGDFADGVIAYEGAFGWVANALSRLTRKQLPDSQS